MKELIIDTLKKIDPIIPYSSEAVELLEGTCATESDYGKYVYQIGGGPAIGKFQMEPSTFNDIIETYLSFNPKLMAKVIEISNVDRLNSKDLASNDILAILFCRVHYFRFKEAIPKSLYWQALYWKKYYNTYKGAGKVKDYVEKYMKYVSS